MVKKPAARYPRCVCACACRYYELSSAGSRVGGKVDREELDQALTLAITCTILAAAGPQRSRMLSTLYKDERAERLPVYPFLEKVYLERILRRRVGGGGGLLAAAVVTGRRGACPN